MKNNCNLILLTFILGILSCSTEKIELDKNSCYPSPNERYTYSVKPGTEQWKQLKSVDEAFEICQLPDIVLKRISTEGLIDALVNSPMFTENYLYSSSNAITTWHRLYSKLNAAEELFKREDSGNVLVEYYKSIDLACINLSDNTIEEKERLFGLEFLFTKSEILKKIDKQNKRELVKALLKNYDINKDNWFTVIAIASVLYNDNYTPLMEYYKKNTNLYKMNIIYGYVDNNQSKQLIFFAKQFVM